MSSWSLVLWRPPPVFDSPAPEEPVYSLNPHVAALLRAEGHLPRPITLTHTLPPSTPPEEAGAAEEEEAPSPLPSVSETEPMDVDVAPEPLAESAEGMVVDEPEPAAEHDATPPTGTSLPSEEDEPSTGVRHQGMHKRPAAEPVDAAKVLKRPFKSPARVVLRGAKRKADSPSSPNSSPALPTQTERPHKLPKVDSPTPAPRSPRSTSSRSRRPVNAKFKPPGPSSEPNSHSSRSSRRRQGGPDADLIASLEQRIRVLKQAQACGEDERVLALIQQWRAAGREITERLFRMIPEPEPEVPKMSKGWGWGWDETPFAEPMPQACVEFIRDECGVKDGEIVDPDGLPVFADEVSLDDILPRSGGKTARPPRASNHDYCPQPPPVVQPWNRGTLLSKLGVDPALLGFNMEEDDWDDMDDD